MLFTILLTAATLGFLYFVFLRPIWEARAAARRRGVSRYESLVRKSTFDESEVFYDPEESIKTDSPGSREQINYLENKIK